VRGISRPSTRAARAGFGLGLAAPAGEQAIAERGRQGPEQRHPERRDARERGLRRSLEDRPVHPGRGRLEVHRERPRLLALLLSPHRPERDQRDCHSAAAEIDAQALHQVAERRLGGGVGGRGREAALAR